MQPNELARFMAKVEMVTESGCWIWTKNLTWNGYGQFFSSDRKALRAHRYAYAALVAPIPDGLCVLHRCDAPACVNPAHLFLGTKTDNMRDAMAKGRNLPLGKGESHSHAKLTEDNVIEIRRRSLTGESYASLSAAFNVKPKQVARIVKREQWKHLTKGDV